MPKSFFGSEICSIHPDLRVVAPFGRADRVTRAAASASTRKRIVQRRIRFRLRCVRAGSRPWAEGGRLPSSGVRGAQTAPTYCPVRWTMGHKSPACQQHRIWTLKKRECDSREQAMGREGRETLKLHFRRSNRHTARCLPAWRPMRKCKPREVVIRRMSRATACSLSAAGFFNVNVSGPDGGTRALGVMGPCEVFGELSLVDGAPRSATVIAHHARGVGVHSSPAVSRTASPKVRAGEG